MNGAASFLLIAIGLSVIGSLAIWAFNRKPKTFMSSIDDFEREMKALGRDPDAPPPRSRSDFRPDLRPGARPGARPEAPHDLPSDDADGAPEESRP
jgi:hypothetical protein